MRKLLLTTVALAFASTPAFAADFAGFRAEAHAGWDHISLDNAELEVDDSDNGVAYGIGIGYDFAVAKGMIVGIETNLDFANTKECGELFGEDELCVKTGRDFDVAARFGTKIGENALLYVKAGYANGRIKAEYEDFEDIIEGFSEAANGDGVRLGAGLEFALGTNAYAKAEYRYTNYEGGFTRNQVLGGFGFRF